jgi:hypothetical protein
MSIRGIWTTLIIILAAYVQVMGISGTETLLVIEPTKEQPRNSEGDIIQSKDGRLCLVYSRFTSGTRDHSAADLAMRTSQDNGKTWTNDRILVPNEGECNVMSVSILRLRNGELLLFYLRKEARLRSCSTYVRRSTDELETLSPPVRVTLLEGYHVVNNDRVVQLSTGRLIVPAALHTGFDETGKVTGFTGKGVPMRRAKARPAGTRSRRAQRRPAPDVYAHHPRLPVRLLLQRCRHNLVQA